MDWTEKPQTYTFATHSGEITSVNSSTKLAHGTSPESFTIVLLQTYISANASYNVFVDNATVTSRGMFALPFFLTVTLTPI